MNEIDLLWIYVQLYGFWVLLIACVGLAIAWGIYEGWMTPKESKQIRSASRKKKAMAILVHDSGVATFQVLNSYGDEGFSDTSRKPEKGWIGYFSRHQPELEEVPVEEGKDKDLTRRAAHTVNLFASRKTHLKFARVPIWFGCHDKSILTSLQSLLAVQTVETLATNGGVIDLSEKAGRWQLVDVYAVKSLFAKAWDATQQRAMKTLAYMRGLNDKSQMHSWELILLWIGGFVVLGLGVALIVLNNFM